MKRLKGALLIPLVLALFFPLAVTQPQAASGEKGGKGGVLVTCTGVPEAVFHWLVEKGIGLWTDNRSLNQDDCGRTLGYIMITFPPYAGLPPMELPGAPEALIILNLTPGSLVASPPGVGVEEVYCRHSVYPLHLYYLRINGTLTQDALISIIDEKGEDVREFGFPLSLLQRAYSSKGYTPVPPAGCSSPLPQLILLGETFFLISETPSGPLVVVGEPSVVPSNKNPFAPMINGTGSSAEEVVSESPPTGNEAEEEGAGAPPPLFRETVGAVETPSNVQVGEGSWGVSRVGLARAFIVIGVVLLILGILGRREERR